MKNIKMLTGNNTHPGSGPLEDHEDEIKLFSLVADLTQNKKNPIMIELGCFWALWSLIYRTKYPEAKNILVELGARALDVGQQNFKMNEYSYTSYHGGVYRNYSGTFQSNECNYEKEPGYWNDDITGECNGPELDFFDIWEKEKLEVVDMLHADIQGSEYPLIVDLQSRGFLKDKKIKTFMIATHHPIIHNNVKKALVENGYNLVFEAPFGSMGGDGMICATIEPVQQ